MSNSEEQPKKEIPTEETKNAGTETKAEQQPEPVELSSNTINKPITAKKLFKIRSKDEVNTEIKQIEEYWDSRDNIAEKIFISGTLRWKTLRKWIILCGGFFLLALVGGYIEPNGIERILDFTATGVGIDIFFMPIYLFIHLLMLAYVGKSLKMVMSVIPHVMSIEYSDYQRSINRIQSKLMPILLALPFMFYDFIYFIPKLLKSFGFFKGQSELSFSVGLGDFSLVLSTEYETVGWLTDTILFLSWMIEWFILGTVIWMLVAYILYIRRITKQYNYDTNLLAIVLKGELNPLIRLGYKMSVGLGFFLILNIYYTIYKGFWLSDFIGSMIILILLIVVSVVPMRIVQKDLAQEQDKFITAATEDILKTGMAVLIDPAGVPLEQKIDLVIKDRMLAKFDSLKKDTVGVYVRLLVTLGISIGGLLYNYGGDILAFINTTFGIKIDIPTFLQFITQLPKF